MHRKPFASPEEEKPRTGGIRSGLLPFLIWGNCDGGNHHTVGRSTPTCWDKPRQPYDLVMHATILHESDLYKSGLMDKIRAASVVHWRIGVAAMSYGVLQVGVRDDLIIVRDPRTLFYAIFARASNAQWLVLLRSRPTKNGKILASARKAAINKARDAGWLPSKRSRDA